MRRIQIVSLICLSLVLGACEGEQDEGETAAETTGEPSSTSSSSGDGDGDATTTTGDGDGDATSTTGDGDGDATATSTSTTGDGDGDAMPNCTGPTMPVGVPDGATQPADPKALGATWAYFELEDFQPQSCNFGQTTSLEAFKGRVTLVTLMRSTCTICQGTISKLEEMHVQLTLEGHDVYMVAINQLGYEASQQEFIDRASFPLLQDVAEVDAWELMNETNFGTDDMYIYTADGQLSAYYSYADANPDINLETQAGWDVIYTALLDALGQ